MTPNPRLTRLKRLERLRAIAKDQAAHDSAEAEETLARLGTLGVRTRSLAESYAARADLHDGQALAQVQRFVAGLAEIERATAADAARAADHADLRQRALAEAERRRTVVEDRRVTTARALRKAKSRPALAARRALGTGLEE